ncbi:MAG TPA: hypothetical protein VD993_11315 [Chitinophagaceae bacterium]|nr:hypothetical protein [Chitinophagaceae bacterium]
MRTVVVFAALLIILFSCNDSAEEFSIVGQVQFALDEKGKIHGEGDTIQEDKYLGGVLHSKTFYDSTEDGRRVIKTFYYDSSGKDSVYLFTIPLTRSARTELIRDKFGNIVEMRILESSSPAVYSLKYINILNADSQAISSRVQDSSGKLVYIQEYSYDSNKRLNEMKTYVLQDTSKVLQSIDTDIYDGKGSKVESMKVDMVSGDSTKREYVYDSRRRLSQERYFKNSSLVHEVSYDYEDNRKKTAIMDYPSLKKKYQIRFYYIK